MYKRLKGLDLNVEHKYSGGEETRGGPTKTESGRRVSIAMPIPYIPGEWPGVTTPST